MHGNILSKQRNVTYTQKSMDAEVHASHLMVMVWMKFSKKWNKIIRNRWMWVKKINPPKKTKLRGGSPHEKNLAVFCVRFWAVFWHMVFVYGFLFTVKELGLLTNLCHLIRFLDPVGSYMYIVLETMYHMLNIEDVGFPGLGF